MVESKQIDVRGHWLFQPLKELAHVPKSLYFKGHLPAQRQIVMAIVGSRKPTPYGREVTFKLAYDLAKRGVVIVSGLAYGIDKIAHEAALEAGGATIAILAGGLDCIYPAGHTRLARQILEKGMLISEQPDGVHPKPYQFLNRNRLISGIADAVIVTEAGEKSGTLSTVNHALDQNKEVFAVPGNITSLLSKGPNKLIQQGAHPVTTAEDILEIIAPDLLQPQTTLFLRSDPAEVKILQHLQQGQSTDQGLQEKSGLKPSDYIAAVTMLEIDRIIQKSSSQQWSIIDLKYKK